MKKHASRQKNRCFLCNQNTRDLARFSLSQGTILCTSSKLASQKTNAKLEKAATKLEFLMIQTFSQTPNASETDTTFDVILNSFGQKLKKINDVSVFSTCKSSSSCIFQLCAFEFFCLVTELQSVKLKIHVDKLRMTDTLQERNT